MNKIKRGIFYQDEQEAIALGSHYYPSFHPKKIPVFSLKEQPKEAEKDLKAMHELGFNLVRFAALGPTYLEDDVVRKDTKFTDQLLEIARKNNLSSLVRLQGYSSNVRNAPYALMQDENGNEIPLKWDYFIRNCLSNPSVVKEDEEITRFLAKHYENNENVIGFQIYNEPAYPFMGFYDYNPFTLKAFHIETGIFMDPPYHRPKTKEELTTWIAFRKFNNRRMNQYLVHLANIATEVGKKPSFTCLMPSAVQQGSAIRGTDFFMITKGMDFLGITLYISPLGVVSKEYQRVLDIANSIARAYQTHAWAIECDARVDMSSYEYEVMMLYLLGSGFKGIMPYQYRADAEIEGAPEPNRYGIVYNDGTETKKYKAVQEMNHFIQKWSHHLAKAEAYQHPVAIYMSQDMAIYQDAITNAEQKNAWKCKEPYAIYSSLIYESLLEKGYRPQFVNMEVLKEKRVEPQVILLPSIDGLPLEEKDYLTSLEKEGVDIRVYNPFFHGYETVDEENKQSATELLMSRGISPLYQVNQEDVYVKVLENEEEYFIFIIHSSTNEKELDQVSILLPLLKEKTIEIIWSHQEIVQCLGETLTIQHLKSGIILRLRKEEK